MPQTTDVAFSDILGFGLGIRGFGLGIRGCGLGLEGRTLKVANQLPPAGRLKVAFALEIVALLTSLCPTLDLWVRTDGQRDAQCTDRKTERRTASMRNASVLFFNLTSYYRPAVYNVTGLIY